MWTGEPGAAQSKVLSALQPLGGEGGASASSRAPALLASTGWRRLSSHPLPAPTVPSLSLLHPTVLGHDHWALSGKVHGASRSSQAGSGLWSHPGPACSRLTCLSVGQSRTDQSSFLGPRPVGRPRRSAISAQRTPMCPWVGSPGGEGRDVPHREHRPLRGSGFTRSVQPGAGSTRSLTLGSCQRRVTGWWPLGPAPWHLPPSPSAARLALAPRSCCKDVGAHTLRGLHPTHPRHQARP